MKIINIYTDGSAKGNPGPGGYGVILEFRGQTKELSQGFQLTTNNRMELLAVIVGLEAIKESGYKIIIYSDSKYVVDAINKKWLFGWEKTNYKKKKNIDLWRRFMKVYRKHDVEIKWVKGHSGHPQNERCDNLAVIAANSNNLIPDKGYFEAQKKDNRLFN